MGLETLIAGLVLAAIEVLIFLIVGGTILSTFRK